MAPKGMSLVRCYAAGVDLYTYILHKQGKWPGLTDEIKAASQRIQYIPGTRVPKDIRYVLAGISGWGNVCNRLLVDQLGVALEISDQFKAYSEKQGIDFSEAHDIQSLVFSRIYDEFGKAVAILEDDGKSEEDKQREVYMLFTRVISEMAREVDTIQGKISADLFAPSGRVINLGN